MNTSKLSQVIKITDRQVNFKLRLDPEAVAVVAAYYAEEAKKQKQKEIRKCAENWCLI